MNVDIFIDESGVFLPPQTTSRKVSCVAAVVIPSSQIARLSSRYERLLHRWNVTGLELKGSKMSEAQVASVIGLLREFEVIAEVGAVDTGMTDVASVKAFQTLQADKLLEQFTDSDEGALISDLRRLKEDMLALPPQLMLQTIVTISLIEELLETATMYFVQRKPEELAEFRWVVDAKSATVTTFEKLWSSIILPIVQTASIRNPLPTVAGADYSYFSRYFVRHEDFPVFLREASERESDHRDGGVDLKKILTDRLSFQDSKVELGLQLADVVASAFSRAMNGTLQRSGWLRLGELLIRRPRLLSLPVNDTADDSTSISAPYAATWNTINSCRRSMLTPRNIRKAIREQRVPSRAR